LVANPSYQRISEVTSIIVALMSVVPSVKYVELMLDPTQKAKKLSLLHVTALAKRFESFDTSSIELQKVTLIFQRIDRQNMEQRYSSKTESS
jgi:hypothetical protein